MCGDDEKDDRNVVEKVRDYFKKNDNSAHYDDNGNERDSGWVGYGGSPD